jgi:hypothetical protein
LLLLTKSDTLVAPMRGCLILIGLIIVLGMVIGIMTVHPTVGTSPNINAGSAASSKTTVGALTKWDYSTIDMDAGAKKERVGCIQSDQQIRLESPYRNTFARLCFGSDNSVMLSIENGQLLNGENHRARIGWAILPQGHSHWISRQITVLR